MKVALVHDYLNQFGGAERVLENLSELFPQAPIYTLFHDPEKMNGRFSDRIIKTSILDKPFVRKRHRFFIPLFAKAAETINLKADYDLIISDSYGFAKGIKYEKGFHISYIHTPLRYAWEPELYLGTLFPKLLIKLASPIIAYLKRWDKTTAQRPDLLLTNSHHIAEKIRNCYNRESTVIYPPVDTDVFYPDPPVKKKSYYLAFGRIMHFKRFDIVVEAFNELNLPLKIVGSGPEEENIRRLIRSPKIEMITGFQEDDNLRRLISGAKALIFPQIEDFGLVAAESIACGTPVIAYKAGGALEIVKDGVNGLFFDEQSGRALTQAVKKFEKMRFAPGKVAETASVFSKDKFKKNFLNAVKSVTL